MAKQEQLDALKIDENIFELAENTLIFLWHFTRFSVTLHRFYVCVRCAHGFIW